MLYQQHPKKINIEYRFFPQNNHSSSKQKAIAALCANQQQKFPQYADLLFKNPQPLNQSELIGFAKAINLNISKFQRCLTSEITNKTLEQDIQEAKRLLLEGTPSLFFNENYFPGFPDDSALETILKESNIK